jgi:hypothetical protein
MGCWQPCSETDAVLGTSDLLSGLEASCQEDFRGSVKQANSMSTSSDLRESDKLIDELLRPSLRRAFPLPGPDQDQRFRILLDALAQLSTSKKVGRSG